LLFKTLARTIKWAVIGLLVLEGLSFVVLHASHYFIYGRLRDYNYAYYDPYTVFNYRDGVRPTVNNSVSPDPNLNRKIWLFGGSTMRGHTDFDERTIPSFMAAELNSRARPYHFRLTNFGEPAFNSILEVKYLEKCLIQDAEAPDLILFYDGINDCIFLCQYRHPEAHYGMRRMRALIENYRDSFLGLLKPVNAYLKASFTKELYDKMNQVVFELDEDDPLLTAYLDHLEQRYDFVDRISRALGSRFVLVWQPMFWAEECDHPEAGDFAAQEILSSVAANTALRHNYTLIYRAVAKRLAGKPYFMDRRNDLCGRQAPLYQPDGIHLRDEGRRIMAEKISEIVLDRLELNRP
jgi:lysophospholipase L1-like esterase